MLALLLRAAAEIAIAVGIALLLRRYVGAFIIVKGNSMSPTLMNGEVLLSRMCRLRHQALRRGDVVICHYPGRGRKYFIKRLVGLPGDTIRRVSGVTMVNGVSLDARASLWRGDYEHVLGPEEYFCVGDNRANSHDSRDWKRPGSLDSVGPIARRQICGVAVWVIAPLRIWRRIDRNFIFEGVAPVIAPETPQPEEDMHEFEAESTI